MDVHATKLVIFSFAETMTSSFGLHNELHKLDVLREKVD